MLINSVSNHPLYREFSTHSQQAYLNHARLGCWPERTEKALQDYAQHMRNPSPAFMQQAFATEQALRQRLATYINAESDKTIALLKNTSEGLSLLAKGIDWQDRDEIVYAKQEFPSNQIVWDQCRATCRVVDLYSDESPEAALINACNENTRLLSISAVQFADGLQMDLQKLGDYCQQHDILFCVDAAQGLGAVPLDVQAMHIDFLLACSHKWLLGAEGLGVFYCRENQREKLQLQQYGWYMLESLESRPWEIKTDATRFQAGSPNTLGIALLSASFSLLEDIGQTPIYELIMHRTDYLLHALNRLGASIVSRQTPERRSGIVSFRFAGMDSDTLCQQLNDENVICSARQGAIRFAPHFYVTEEQLAFAIKTLEENLRSMQ
jgi:cysteine desulfurase/selenocysteine lyase